MDTIVKVLNEKVEGGNAKTVVEALKQIDPNAEGETVAEVLKKMELGGGSGGFGKAELMITNIIGEELWPVNFVDGADVGLPNNKTTKAIWTLGSLAGTYAVVMATETTSDINATVTNGGVLKYSLNQYGRWYNIFVITVDGDITQGEVEIGFTRNGGAA